MQPCEKKGTWFKSADGATEVAAYFYSRADVTPFCVLQITHGMVEYIARYDHFAEYLTANGVAVCGHDHLGHGATAKMPEDEGYFSGKGGRAHVLQDIHTMNTLAHEKWPGLPVILLGHSMGSFFAREYVTRWPETVSAVIFSGTGGANPVEGAGIALTALLSAVRGGRYRSKLVDNMAFGAYCKQIPDAKTKYDWLSRDDEVVAKYAADPQCTRIFTVGGFNEMMKTLRDVNKPAWAAAVPKDMPVCIFSGGADPVGDYGKGVTQVYEALQQNGLADLSCKLYPGGRHEMLNETNHDEVYADVLAFLQKHGRQA